MRILTEADPPRKRRVPVALMILAMVVLPLMWVFGWSWIQPITLRLEGHGVGFGYGYRASSTLSLDAWLRGKVSFGCWSVPDLLLRGNGKYYAWWY